VLHIYIYNISSLRVKFSFSNDMYKSSLSRIQHFISLLLIMVCCVASSQHKLQPMSSCNARCCWRESDFHIHIPPLLLSMRNTLGKCWKQCLQLMEKVSSSVALFVTVVLMCRQQREREMKVRALEEAARGSRP